MKVPFRLGILLPCWMAYLFIPYTIANNCSSGTPTFSRRLFIHLQPESIPIENLILVHETPPSECFSRCVTDDDCSAYFVSYRNQSCLLVNGIQRDLSDKELVRNEDSSYHRKLCMPPSTCGHEWAFDEVEGVQLFHYFDKTLTSVSSSDECMNQCLKEPTFTCRSAKYDSQTQECVLSRHDRRSASEYFRQATNPDSTLYMERQCVQEPHGCQFRSRQSRAILRRHRHVQVISNITSKEACEDACMQSVPFSCRSYQYSGEPAVCLLSPEDSASEWGPLFKSPGTFSEDNRLEEGYFERESCVDVEVKCGPTAISTVVRVATPFRGRVYAAGHPYECYSVTVSTGGFVTLTMPLHGRQCGTKNMGNGTFINSVVVQHHSFVLRTSDRRIDVACDYEEKKLKIRGSKSVKQGEMKPLAQTVTANAPTPPIRLRVVNGTDQDVKGVELGDPLFLKVEMADESVYGIFGSDLVAKGSSGTETVLLIDENGCSVEPNVIQALDKLPGSKSLIAPFQAFKFASDSAVQFQMTVSYCLDTCPPVDCNVPKSSNSQSYGKRRRRKRSTSKFFDILPGDVISDVTMESPMFLVTNLKPALNGEQAKLGFPWERDFEAEDRYAGHIRVKVKNDGMCVSLTTLYILCAVIGVIQIAIVCACTVVFCKSGTIARDRLPNSSSKSWPSVSSRRQLVCS